jgi:hypothetical protein
MTVPAQRDARGRLLPGFSGNPGGRPKGIEAVRELLRPSAPAFVAALVDLLKSPNEMTRLAAFREFMDRLVGRPVQVTEADVRTVNMGALFVEAARLAQPAPIMKRTKPSQGQARAAGRKPCTIIGRHAAAAAGHVAVAP